MKTRLVQFLTGLLTAGALLLSFSAQAGCDNGGCNPCSIKKCCKLDCCTPSDDCCGFDGAVWGEVLVWNLCQNQAWATKVAAPTTTYHYLDSEWDVGFRVGGTLVTKDCWDMTAVFTYFASDTSANITGTAGSLQPQLSNMGLTVTDVTSAHTKSELDYCTLDVVFGSRCCACENLAIRPFGGFRGVWIEQDVAEHITSATFTGNRDGGLYNNDFSAFGLHSGFDYEYCFFGPLTLVGKFAGSIVAGDEEQTFTYTTANVVTGKTLMHSEVACPFNLETSVGLDYEDSLCDFDLGLRVSYEFVYWSHVSNPYSASDDLAMHGVSIQGRLEF